MPGLSAKLEANELGAFACLSEQIRTRAATLLFHEELPEAEVNRAMSLRLSKKYPDAALEELARMFVARKRTPVFVVTPMSRPLRLRAVLSEQGYAQVREVAVLILAREGELRAGDGVDVRVCSPKDARAWTLAYRHARGLPADVEGPLLQQLQPAFSKRAFSFYLARIGQKPVGTAFRFSRRDVGGLYGLAMMPEARDPAVGDALVRQVLQDHKASEDESLTVQAHEGTDAWRLLERAGFGLVYRQEWYAPLPNGRKRDSP